MFTEKEGIVCSGRLLIETDCPTTLELISITGPKNTFMLKGIIFENWFNGIGDNFIRRLINHTINVFFFLHSHMLWKNFIHRK